jgi:hypothetical protein
MALLAAVTRRLVWPRWKLLAKLLLHPCLCSPVPLDWSLEHSGGLAAPGTARAGRTHLVQPKARVHVVLGGGPGPLRRAIQAGCRGLHSSAPIAVTCDGRNCLMFWRGTSSGFNTSRSSATSAVRRSRVEADASHGSDFTLDGIGPASLLAMRGASEAQSP